MLNTEHFTLLAGNPGLWDAELDRRVEAGESLPDVQVDQHRRGRRSAHLVKGVGGFYVRYASGLDNFGILLHGWHSREDAINWGKAWAEQDPNNREFYARNDMLEE